MASKSFENGIKEFLEYQLPIFDDILVEAQKPLSERPLAAAFYFVDYCIVDIKGDSKDNFFEKEWFKSIYKLIKQWYDDRYGGARKSSKDSFALGVALIYKTPFELEIPLSIAQEWEGTFSEPFESFMRRLSLKFPFSKQAHPLLMLHHNGFGGFMTGLMKSPGKHSETICGTIGPIITR